MNKKILEQLSEKIIIKWKDELLPRLNERSVKIEEDKNNLSIICSNDLFKEFNSWTYKNLSSDVLKIKYSFNGVRFEIFFNLKQLYNGSDPRTLNRLKNAIKFQMIANYEDFNDFDKATKHRIAFLYGNKLFSNINNNITFNNEEQKLFKPITACDILEISKNIIYEIEEGNYSIYDINNQEKIIDVKNKNKDYHTMRITYEELENLINDFFKENGKKPTIKELREYYNKIYKIDEIEDYEELTSKSISETLMRKYVKLGNLQEMIENVYTKKP